MLSLKYYSHTYQFLYLHSLVRENWEKKYKTKHSCPEELK